MEKSKRRARFDADRLIADMARRGWNNAELARAAGVSEMTVARFLSGEIQTAKMAGRFAASMGFSKGRYFSHIEAIA